MRCSLCNAFGWLTAARAPLRQVDGSGDVSLTEVTAMNIFNRYDVDGSASLDLLVRASRLFDSCIYFVGTQNHLRGKPNPASQPASPSQPASQPVSKPLD